MTKFFFKFKKNYFWSISPIFGGKKSFTKKSGIHNLIKLSSTILKFRETIPRKKTQQTAGWTDRRSLFYETLLDTARGPTSTTAADWHLKLKDIGYNVSLSKNYCFTVSMQIIS